jgi:hypothetical protein
MRHTTTGKDCATGDLQMAGCCGYVATQHRFDRAFLPGSKSRNWAESKLAALVRNARPCDVSRGLGGFKWLMGNHLELRIADMAPRLVPSHRA